MKKCKFLIILMAFFICFSNVVVFADEVDEETVAQIEEVKAELASAVVSNDIVLNSRSAIVFERNSKLILYGKNENNVVAMASTTKIMTAIVVLENVKLEDIVVVSKKAANTGGSRLELSTDMKISVNDLLYGLLLCSGNDAAVALAEYVGGSVEGFSELMNLKVKELGLENTNFESPHGLDSAGHYTTPYELAVITDYALNNEVFRKIVGTKTTSIWMGDRLKQINNTNELLGNLEGVYGVKTGFTNNAGRCLVTATKRNGLDIICVVLGADTKKIRTKDSAKLIEYICSNYENIDIEAMIQTEFEDWKVQNINNFIIEKGVSQKFDLGLEEIKQKAYTINKNEVEKIDIVINNIFEFQAPVKEKSIIGNLKVIVEMKNGETEIIESINIINLKEVKKKSMGEYLILMFDSI